MDGVCGQSAKLPYTTKHRKNHAAAPAVLRCTRHEYSRYSIFYYHLSGCLHTYLCYLDLSFSDVSFEEINYILNNNTLECQQLPQELADSAANTMIYPSSGQQAGAINRH